jgi:hypothetical protein
MSWRSLGKAVAAGAAACAGLLAQPALARSDWPHTLPAQPLAQAPFRCAAGVTPLNHRCHVIDFAAIGRTSEGRPLYYAFYGTRWADRHGRLERGFPVIFYQEGPATLRLGLWINDEPGLTGRWAMTPPPRPTLLNRPDGDYLGFILKAVKGPADDERLFRRNKLHWKEVDILHRKDADQAKLDSVTPKSCEPADEGFYDWPHFRLVQALRDGLTHAPCGFVYAELEVRDMHLAVTSAAYLKTNPGERASPPAPQAPLTPATVGHTSPSR